MQDKKEVLKDIERQMLHNIKKQINTLHWYKKQPAKNDQTHIMFKTGR